MANKELTETKLALFIKLLQENDFHFRHNSRLEYTKIYSKKNTDSKAEVQVQVNTLTFHVFIKHGKARNFYRGKDFILQSVKKLSEMKVVAVAADEVLEGGWTV